MRHGLFGLVSKKKLDAIEEKYYKKEQKLKNKIRDLHDELQDINNNQRLAKRVFQLLPGSEIVAIGENKYEELYVVKSLSGSMLTVYLVGKSYNAINNLPRIMCSINTDHSTNDKYIKINDIQNVDNDIGNGSLVMTHLLEMVEKVGIKYIVGLLSSVDSDHFDRSEHFYIKFGFDVNLNEERTSGSIKKKL